MAKSVVTHSAARLALIILSIIAVVQVWTWTGANAQSFTTYQDEVLSDNPTVFLTFDQESLANAAGSIEVTRNGTEDAGLEPVTLSYISDTAFGAGRALSMVSSFQDFQPSDPAFLIETADGASLLTQDITIEALIRLASSNDGDTLMVAQVGTRFEGTTSSVSSVDGGGFIFGADEGLTGFNEIGAAVFDSSATSSGRTLRGPIENNTPDWQHVVMTHSQTTAGGEARIYVDGELVAQAATDGIVPFDAAAPYALLGPTIDDAAADYQTDPVFIDEYAIYPTALSEERIAAHYAAISGDPVDPGDDDPLGIGGSTEDPFVVSEFDVSGTEQSGGLTFDNCGVNIDDLSVAACFAITPHLNDYLRSAGLPAIPGDTDTNADFDVLGSHRFTSQGELAVIGEVCTGTIDVRGTFWELPVVETFHGCPGIEYFDGLPTTPGVNRDFSNGTDEYETVNPGFDVAVLRYLDQPADGPAPGTALTLTPEIQTVSLQSRLVSLRANVVDSEAQGPVRFVIGSGPSQGGVGVCQESERIFLGDTSNTCPQFSDGSVFWGFANTAGDSGTSQVLAFEDANNDGELDDDEPRAIAQVVWVDQPLTDAERFGNRSDSSHVSDPINTASGNFMMPGPAIGFGPEVYGMSFVSTYNSLEGGVSDLGIGWSTSLDEQVRFDDGSTIEVTWVDGRVLRFEDDGAGGFLSPSAFDGALTPTPDGYRIDTYDGASHLFNASGQLVEMRNWDDQIVTFTYDDLGRAVSQTSSLGVSLDFTYTDGLLTAVTTSDGRSLQFGHMNSLVSTWANPEGETTTFTYGIDGYIAAVTDPSDVVQVINVYDEIGRVASQTVANGETSTFSYDADTLSTTMVVTPGDETFVYYHDAEGRLIRAVDPTSEEITSIWDDNGNVVSETDRADDSGDSLYDDANNLLETEHPRLGTASYDYDDLNRLVSYSAHGMTTEYTYEGALRIPATVTIDGELRMARDLSDDGLVLSATDADGISTTYEYNTLRQITAVIDGLGNRAEFEYDGAGNRVLSRSPIGNETRWVYDADNRLISSTNALGDTGTWTYDDAGRISTVTDRRGFVTTFSYDDNGYRASMIDPRSNTTTYSYDWDERSMSTTRPGGATSIVDHGVLWRVESATDPEGRTTTTTYDSAGRPVGTQAPDGTTTGMIYGPGGEVISRTDSAGRVTSYTYDDFGRVVRIDHPGGEVESLEYDTRSRVVAATDASDGRTVITYSDADRIVAVENADGLTTTYAYDAAGRVSAVTTPSGTTNMEYDADSRLTAVMSPSGDRATMSYDAVGRMLTSTDPAGVTVAIEYDADGRATSVVEGIDAPISLSHDGVGLIGVVDQAGGQTSLGHDGRNNRTTFTDQVGGTWNYGFNLADQQTSMTDPLGRVSTINYDESGRLQSTEDPSGRTMVSAYDPQTGELASVSTTDTTTSYGYDDGGRIDLISSPSGSVIWEYDDRGLPISVTDADGSVTTYEWDGAGNRVATVTPSGERIEHERNVFGQLEAISTSGGTIEYAYDADRRQIETVFSSGWTRSTEYVDGRVASFADGQDSWAVQYDGSGRVSSISGADEAEYSFGPDALLESAAVNGMPHSYSYDAVGNIASSSIGGVDRSFTHDAANQIIGAVHDDAGRITAWTDIDGTLREYVYDDFGRLEAATYTVAGEGGGEPTPPLELCDNPTIVGTDGRDHLRGTSGDDIIVTLGGNDTVDGRGGNDVICAMEGNNRITTGGGADIVIAGDGRDRIFAGPGDDTIFAGDGHNRITAGNGADVIVTGAGDDTVVAGVGNDDMYLGDGRNVAYGGNGNDLFVTGAGRDFVSAGNGADEIFTGAERDVIYAGSGVDYIDAGADHDRVYGGLGADECTNAEFRRSCDEPAEPRELPTASEDVVETWSRSYTPDGLLASVTQTAAGGTVNAWEITWDRVGGLPMPLEITENGQTRVYVNGHRPEGVLVDGAFQEFERNPFGDVGGTLSSPFGDVSAADRAVELGYRGMLRVGDEYHTIYREYSPILGRFLSPDPVGHIGSGSPRVSTLYAYGANDPINTSDRTGLSPTDSGFSVFGSFNPSDWTVFNNPVINVTAEGLDFGADVLLGAGETGAAFIVDPDYRDDVFTGAVIVWNGDEELLEGSRTDWLRRTFVFDERQCGLAGGEVSEGGCALEGLGIIPFGRISRLRHLEDTTDLGRGGGRGGNVGGGSPAGTPGVPCDLHCFGNTTAPRPPRPSKDITVDASGNVHPTTPPTGASAFGDPGQAPLMGHYWVLPEGTTLPDGLRVVADGADVGGPHAPTHHTIFPSRPMPFDEFVELFESLPWEYGGKK